MGVFGGQRRVFGNYFSLSTVYIPGIKVFRLHGRYFYLLSHFYLHFNKHFYCHLFVYM